jgi:putative membrane protein
VLGAAAVLAQISYPLLSGAPLRRITIASVLLFAAASLAHAGAALGPRAAVRLLIVGGGTGLAAEAVGVATGVPFGAYRYGHLLGPGVLGVPLLVPLAWTMMAYPCLLLGRRLAGVRAPRSWVASHRVRVALTGGGTLAAWDLFLDPQMVAAGHWTWAHPSPGLPGVPGIPLTNYAGWLLVAPVLVLVLDLALPVSTRAGTGSGTGSVSVAGAAGEAVPAAMLAWTWLGSAVGNVVFFGRPVVAAYGLVAMGAGVLPFLVVLRRAASSERAASTDRAAR